MISSLNKLKHSLLNLVAGQKIESDMNIKSDIVENYEDYVVDFLNATTLLEKAIQAKDQIAIRCALTRVRMASLNMSNIYQDIIDDVVMINQQNTWPEIPEGYRLPEHYNKSN